MYRVVDEPANGAPLEGLVRENDVATETKKVKKTGRADSGSWLASVDGREVVVTRDSTRSGWQMGRQRGRGA
ncbi:hypothetical protein E4U22_007021 [Claviceps purpurea]|nr:hypothetical protein E4U37_004540 [Claviceps purpurea]KAG6188189.1 hypothetical protein E4U27_007460 [Claviceps purpurea]KAG6316538.1 hypothetical protein E4U22_007021 [Claviceps purpurea]